MKTVPYFLTFETRFLQPYLLFWNKTLLLCIQLHAATPAGPAVFVIPLAYTEPHSPAILLPVVDPAVATKLTRDPHKK